MDTDKKYLKFHSHKKSKITDLHVKFTMFIALSGSRDSSREKSGLQSEAQDYNPFLGIAVQAMVETQV